MGKYDHLATRPARHFGHVLKWKLGSLGGGKRQEEPDYATPRRENDGSALETPGAHLTWLGHASFAARLGGSLFAVDPVLTPALLGVQRRLTPPGVPVESLANRLDLVLVTHNHYDHLDLWTLERLGRRPTYIVPVGNRRYLGRVQAERVVELDWWETHRERGLEITLVPARHWSVRRGYDRNDALWGGYVVKSAEGTLYHSGDTALFDGFREIGERLGPIDWALLPIGAYEPRWFMQPQHMNPEDAGEAFEMLGARHLVAMHWGTFRLTDEPVSEPPLRLRAWAESKGLGSDRIWILDVGEARALR